MTALAFISTNVFQSRFELTNIFVNSNKFCYLETLSMKNWLNVNIYFFSIVKHLEETDPDRVSTFKEKAPLFVKKVKESFKDLQFFQGK